MAQRNPLSLMSMVKTVFLASLIVTLPILTVRFFGGFEGAELAAYDQFLRWRSSEGPDDRIVVVTISDDDIEVLQEYPIHDGTLAKALDKLVSYEPRGIGLDISRDVPHGPPEGRKQLTQVIKDNPLIISGCLLSTETHPGSPPAPGSDELSVGFVDFPVDPDTSVRRTKLVSIPAEFKKHKRTQHICNNAQGNELLSLSFQLALLYLEPLQIHAEQTKNSNIALAQTVFQRLNPRFGGYAHAETNDYQLMLNYRRGEQPFRQISITQVLDNQVDPRSIHDRIVLIGYTSEVSKDFLKTPYLQADTGSQDMFGVLVHAHAVSQLLSAVVNQRLLISSWPVAVGMIWIVGWAVGGGVLSFYTRSLGLFFLGCTVMGILLGGGSYSVFVYQGLWIPVVPAMVALILTAVGVRVIDLGTRSGYAQAIYEQLREQLLSNAANRDRKGDYLENLVRRARAARGQDSDLAPSTPSPASELPDMTLIYEQVAAQVKQDMAAEQARHHATVNQLKGGGNKRDRMQTLLNRAQQSRQQSSLPSPTPAPPPTEEPHA